MHVPNNGTVCPVTVAVSALTTAAIIYVLQKNNRAIPKQGWAAISLLIFIVQAVIFPLAGDISGHLFKQGDKHHEKIKKNIPGR